MKKILIVVFLIVFTSCSNGQNKKTSDEAKDLSKEILAHIAHLNPNES